jgi:predicted HicB family RNase H-like nuclease
MRQNWDFWLVGVKYGSAFGDSSEQALAELETGWQLTKESYAANDEEIPVAPSRRKYSGQFNIRVDKRVHRALAIEAARAGVSLNALISKKLSENLVQ